MNRIRRRRNMFSCQITGYFKKKSKQRELRTLQIKQSFTTGNYEKLCCTMQGSTIGVHGVRVYAYFYWHTHDFGHAYVVTYAHF